MTTAEIAALSGRPLDEAVHRLVFGKVTKQDKWGHWWTDEVGALGLNTVPFYSREDCRCLSLVLAWLRERGWLIVMTQYLDCCEVELKRSPSDRFGRHQVTGDTLPEAVARVTLMVMSMGEPMSDEREDGEWGLVTPFWIDTDAYTDRDRLLFCCGVEFHMIYRELKAGEEINTTIHTENESRIRMLCGKLKRKCELKASEVEGWTYLMVEVSR